MHSSTTQNKPDAAKKLQTMKTLQLGGQMEEDDSMIDLQYEKEQNTISHEKMKQSFKKRHAVKPDGSFYSCKEACWKFNAGAHYLLKSSEKSDLTKFGVGIMLYFKFVKHLMFYFFIFTLLSIPAFVFYISAYADYNKNSNDSVSYIAALTATTVGSVGFGSTSCAVRKYPLSASLTEQNQLFFECPTGTIASIDNVVYGLSTSGTTCTFIEEADLVTSCNSYDTSALYTSLSSCVGKSSCSAIDVPTGIFNSDDTCMGLYSTMDVYMKVGCEASTVTVAGNYVYKSTIAYVVAAFDAGIIIFFVVMIFTLKFAQKNATETVQQKAYSAASYTVEFKNLPQDMPAEELSSKLWEFLDQKLGDKSVQAGHRVIDIQVVLPNKLIEYSKDVGSIIQTKNTLIREFIQTYLPDYAKTEVDLNGLQEIMKSLNDKGHPKLKEAQKQFAKIKSLSEKKMKLLREIQKMKTTKFVKIVSAFVTFSTIAARDKMLETFISSPLQRFLRFCCAKSSIKNMMFYGKLLRVRSSSDPGSILWENLGEPGFKVFLRRTFSWVLTLALWVLTAAILIVSTYYKNYFKNSYPTVDCGDKSTAVSDVVADYKLGAYQKNLLECFCTEDLVGNLNYVFTDLSNQTLCLTWFTNKVIETSITFAIVFCVLIVNYFVQFVFQGLSLFEKHSTLNKQLATRVIKTFAAQFLNTGLLILLINIKIDDISFWQGKFRDINPVWYSNVGSTLLSTMVINIISVPTIKIVFVLMNKFARCLDRNCKSDERITKKKTQKSYEELYSGPEFIIDYRYSQILTLIFVCFLYSAGMPLLYATSFLQLLITYFFDKVLLLKVSKLPKNYDEKLESVVRPILYVILFLHLVFAIFMFGNSQIFSPSMSTFSSLAGASTSISDTISKNSENVFKKFFRRTVLDFNIVLLILLIALIVIFLVKGVFLGVLRRTIFAIFAKDEENTKKKGQVSPSDQTNHTFFNVIKTEDIATLIRLTKVTLKVTENQDLITHLKTKLSLLKQEYKIKEQSKAEPVNFIGFFSYDVRLQPSYAAQFAMNEMLDDEDLE